MFPPPPHPLVDSSGGQRFLVERILNHRDVNGIRTSYLVRWRGFHRRGTAGSLVPS
uniref:Chromo domain-containing protein n=1 Tax=Peronospora matthiolae TaxID=2874970 RepID=A0AAV1TP16_9STRA